MVPTPEGLSANGPREDVEVQAGHRVVISGMSGLYPNADHVPDLANILYNKINPVTAEEPRYDYTHPEVTQYLGKVHGLRYFDAQFFKVHYRLANAMDPTSRKMLEQTYQAIYDAGVSPEHLYGKKIGVYIGTCFSESEKGSLYDNTSRTGFGIPGCSKTMFANRISYWLNAKASSMSVDQACSSSTAALELAYQDIMRGECEAAIVGGSNLCLHPQTLVHYSRIMKLSKDGKTKSFDENAEGCAKSDAINVLFLQKAKDALRIYAEIVYVKTEFTSMLDGETGPLYGFIRNPKDTIEFLKGFYDEAKVPPQNVQYVEAYGSANSEADKSELEAIEKIFCNGRSNPLLVGSVMSNIGYGEAASGITAITKVLLGYHTGQLAANLHCTAPRRDVTALCDGRIRIVTEHERFSRSYTAVNGFSFSGVNSHVLLHGCYKPKDLTRYKSSIPHLVLISGRQESAVKKVFENLKNHPVDPEELALLHNFHLTRISGNLARGFAILENNEQIEALSLREKVSYLDYVKRPIWFVYSGMGSQWAGMGEHLMKIPIFAAAIAKCDRVLQPKGLDIVQIITTRDKTVFDNILHSFVGIAAIQIGLTDILTELGIVPDKIIGHSVGELGCAYADGCFTAEEMILSAYSRGLVSVQTPLIRGSMAAVGIGYQHIISMCPPSIEVACHNSSESCTISGPADAMREFVKTLVANKIFAKEVPSSNIAFHSRYIADAGCNLLKYLKEVIKSPKARSERWLSTSVPEDKWNEKNAKFSSPEYHTNNLLSPVLFEETSRLIPADAILVEIAPHGLLQAILKRSLPESCCNVPLTLRGHYDSVLFLLEAIGKLYSMGLNPNVQALYPKIEFPVSTGTPMLSHLVEWAHHETWNLAQYSTANRKPAAAAQFVISLHDDEHSYLQGHVIKGKVLYPFAAVLVAVWDTLAMTLNEPRGQRPVEFREVELNAQPALHQRRLLRLSVTLQRGTGYFEVTDDINSKVASGFVTLETEEYSEFDEDESYGRSSGNLEITSPEIYDNFCSRDFYYKNNFKSIHSVNSDITEALVVWRDNWVTFIDALIQLNLLRHSLESHSYPNFIRKLVINPEEHCKSGIKIKKAVMENQSSTRCGGVLMETIKFHDIPVSEHPARLKALKLVPHFSTEQFELETIIQVYIQIVTENVEKGKLNILGIYDNNEELSKLYEVKSILDQHVNIINNFRSLKRDSIMQNNDIFLSNVNVVLVFNISSDSQIYQILFEVLQNNAFVINIAAKKLHHNISHNTINQVVCKHNIETGYIELSRWGPTPTSNVSSVITMSSNSDFSLISDKLNNFLPHQKLVVLTTHPAPEGLKEYLHDLKNANGPNIHLVMSDNGNYGGADKESLVNVDLAVQVFKNNTLGGEYFVPIQSKIVSNKNVTLQSSVIGKLESLRWEELSLKQEPGTFIKVHYAGLNDLDVKRATGIVPFGDNNLKKGYGMEFSGVTESGLRVMGLVAGGAMSSSVHVCPDLVWPVPEHWSLEDAATVPLAYNFAYYCFVMKFPLYRGVRVLIHSGAGALGQALIAIALALDCEVFATVGDVRKKQFLLKIFPTLKAENIGNSRDASFCDLVLNATNGKGVDFAICNLRGELKTVTMNCVAFTGCIIDVAQISSNEKYKLRMNYLEQERSYFSVNFSSIFNNNDKITMKKLQRLVGEGIARGWVRPLSRVVYGPREVTRAFRLLAGANQRGRALVRLSDPHDAQSGLPCTLPSVQCSPDQCHVIFSDHDCYGQHLANKLVSCGVRKLCLYLPLSSNHLKLKIRQWQSMGVDVRCEVLHNTSDVLDSFMGNQSQVPIEGIYIAVTNTTTPVLVSASFVAKMDTLSRKLFPGVKYFAVINTVNSVGAETCKSRVLNGFPGTMIKLPEITEISVERAADTRRVTAYAAAAATESALCTAEPVVAADFTCQQRLSLLQQIAQVADIAILPDTKDTATLSDLGMNLAKLDNVRVFLRDVHNVHFTDEDIQTLTVQRINNIDETLTKTNFEDEKGLKTLFSYVDSDELLATTEMVFLPTLSTCTTMRADEFDVNETYLYIVPGVEGHHERFRKLSAGLQLPVLVLQPGLHKPRETILETAHRYVKILLEMAGLRTNYYLMGYESGVLVALEMAALLEDRGLTGTVFCLGVPPAEFKNELRDHLNGLDTEEALQNAVVQHMFKLMTGEESEELSVKLRSAGAWQEKVESAVRLLLGRVSHSAQYAQQIIDGALGRLETLQRYEVAPRALHSRLVLLKPAPAPPSAASLQPHSLKPVTVHALNAPLAHATEDLRCANIINSYLDDSILQAFRQKNHCDTYLLNAGLFIKYN